MLQELGQLAAVAERVRAPELAAAEAELLLEEALAVEEVAEQRLAGGEVAIGLDPRAADRDEPTGGDLLPDARPEPGLALADPVVVDGLRAGEAVLGVLVHQPQLGRERAHGLAAALGERPEPGRVEVRVADRGELVGVRAVDVLVQLSEEFGVAR